MHSGERKSRRAACQGYAVFFFGRRKSIRGELTVRQVAKTAFRYNRLYFLCDITKIRIAFYGKGKEINKNEFGYIGEVSFEKENFLSLIKTDGGTLAFSAILGFICYKEKPGIIEIIRVAVVISATILFMF